MDLPDPKAICLEDLDTGRFVRCVAIAGGRSGLTLGTGGQILWRSDQPSSAEIWVTADSRLALRRPEGAGRATVSRSGRTVLAPVGKPVILLAGDELEAGGRRLRLHVHGRAPQVHAPQPLAPERGAGMRLATAALALGMTGCILVRPNPPEPMPDPHAQVERMEGEQVGVPVFFEVVDEAGLPIPTAAVQIIPSQSRHLVDSETGTTTVDRIDHLDGSSSLIEVGQELQITVSAPAYATFKDTHAVSRQHNNLRITLPALAIEVREEPPVIVLPEDEPELFMRPPAAEE